MAWKKYLVVATADPAAGARFVSRVTGEPRDAGVFGMATEAAGLAYVAVNVSERMLEYARTTTTPEGVFWTAATPDGVPGAVAALLAERGTPA